MSPPPGFEQLPIPSGFAADFGPIYARREGERVWFGFRVERMHLNPNAVTHGGALATFADMQLVGLMRTGVLVAKQAPTISLSLDFLAPSRVGDWVEGEVTLVKRTGRLAFSDALLSVEGSAIVRARGLYSYSDNSPPLDASRLDIPAQDVEVAPPPGFEPVDPGPDFGAYFGPLYWRRDPERLAAGFRVARRHVNLFGACHGGALATFADYQVSPLRRAGLISGPMGPTLSLQVDYLSAARLGDWVEAETRLVRQTGRYAFTQAIISNAAGPVARTTAIYAIPRG